MHHGVYEVPLPDLALHPLPGAGHGGTGGRGRSDQQRDEDTSSEASHGRTGMSSEVSPCIKRSSTVQSISVSS